MVGPSNSLIDYLNLVRRHRLVFVTTFVAFLALVIAVTMNTDPVYESATSLIVEPTDPSSRISLLPIQSLPRQAVEVNNDVEVLRSHRLMSQVVERLDRGGTLRQFDRIRARAGDPVTWLRKSVAVRLIKSTDIIQLTAQAGDPREAMQIANMVAEVYIDFSRHESRARVGRVKEFLDEQVRLARDRLAVTEASLKEFQETERVASIDEETAALIDQLAKSEGTLRANEVDLRGRRERLRQLVEQRDKTVGDLSDIMRHVDGPLTVTLRLELAEVMARYARFQAEGYATQHEKMEELDRKIAALKSRLAADAKAIAEAEGITADPVGRIDRLGEQIITEQVEIQALEAQGAALAHIVGRYQASIEHLPAKAHRLAQLQRAAKVEETILVMLQQRFEEARIEEAGDAGRCRVIDLARIPVRPVRPRPLLSLLLGAVFGVGIAYGACALAGPLERHIDSPEIAQQRSGLRILGKIPLITADEPMDGTKARFVRKLLGGGAVERRRTSALVSAHSNGSRVVEAYRSLRTVLQFVDGNSGPHTILVTSAGSADGKTTTAANLAITFAASGERVLLVDADMRKPRMHVLFDLRLEGGLREVLAGEIDLEPAVHRSTIPDLDILTAGARVQNPTELLASSAMTDFIKHARGAYGYVVIDSPPVLPVTDPAILSTRVDATVFVVRHRYTPKAALEYAISVLRCLPIRLAGVVYNEDTESDHHSSYHYGYYGYYGRSESQKGEQGTWISEDRSPHRRRRRREQQEAA